MSEFDIAHMLLGSEAHMHAEEIESIQEDYLELKRRTEWVRSHLKPDENGHIFTDENVLHACRLAASSSGRYVSGQQRMKNILADGVGNCSARTKYICSILKELFPELVVLLDQYTYVNRNFGHVFPVVRLPESGQLYSIDMGEDSQVHIEEFNEAPLTFAPPEYLYMVGYIRRIIELEDNLDDKEVSFVVPTTGIDEVTMGHILQAFQQGEGYKKNDFTLPGRRRLKRLGESESERDSETATNSKSELGKVIASFREMVKSWQKAHQTEAFLIYMTVMMGVSIGVLMHLLPYTESESFVEVEIVDRPDVFVRFSLNNDSQDALEVKVIGTRNELAQAHPMETMSLDEKAINELPQQQKEEGRPVISFHPEEYVELAEQTFSQLVHEFCESNPSAYEMVLEREAPPPTSFMNQGNRLTGISRVFGDAIQKMLIRDTDGGLVIKPTNPTPPSRHVLQFGGKNAGCKIHYFFKLDTFAGYASVPLSFLTLTAQTREERWVRLDDYWATISYAGLENEVLEPVYVSSIFKLGIDDGIIEQKKRFVCNQGRVMVTVDDNVHVFMSWDVWDEVLEDQPWLPNLFAADMTHLESLNDNVWYQCQVDVEDGKKKFKNVDFPVEGSVL